MSCGWPSGCPGGGPGGRTYYFLQHKLQLFRHFSSDSYSWPFGKQSPSCSCTKAKSGTRGSMVAKLKLKVGNPSGQNRVSKVQ